MELIDRKALIDRCEVIKRCVDAKIGKPDTVIIDGEIYCEGYQNGDDTDPHCDCIDCVCLECNRYQE